jgi:4-hydroxybenzoate polyprenyltransferase
MLSAEYLRLARFDHWIKQLFVIPGVVIAIVLTEVSFGGIAVRFLLGFIATCLIASANYIINEWLDAGFDKYHPTKKHRSAVMHQLDKKKVYILYGSFALVGLLVAISFSTEVFYCCFSLLLMGIIYNVMPFRTKDIAYLDVLSESINNAIRLLIGWFIITATYLPPITIILGYWMAGGFLMSMKRYAEYNMINDPVMAVQYRKSFRKYTKNSLLNSAFFYALISLFFCGVFMIKYKLELIFLIPPVCGLYCYYLAISTKADSAVQKPEKLYKETGLMCYVLALILLFCVLMFVQIPTLDFLLDTTLLKR